MHERGRAVLCLRFTQFSRAGWPMSSNRNAASEPHSRERSNNAYHTRPSCLKICLSGQISLPTKFHTSLNHFLYTVSKGELAGRTESNSIFSRFLFRNVTTSPTKLLSRDASRKTREYRSLVFKVVISWVRDIFS